MRHLTLGLILGLLLLACHNEKNAQPLVEPPPPTGDVTPPSAVTDLAADSVYSGGVTLRWTAPGDDGREGLAARYYLRYAPDSLTAASWATAREAANVPAPRPAGRVERVSITGLDAGRWCFALRSRDEVPNWSELSNILAVNVPPVLPVSRVTDLAITATSGGSVSLAWTSPGGHEDESDPVAYELRYANATITDSTWAAATGVSGLAAPATPGTSEATTVLPLPPETAFCFAIRTVDREGHWSALSNLAQTTTLSPALERLTTSQNSWGVQAATWSPDGQSIVFAADWQGRFKYNYYRVPVSGGEAELIATPQGQLLPNGPPALSPDGSRLAIGLYRSEDFRSHLLILNLVTGGDPIEVLSYSNRTVMGITWSPDGTYLAYQTQLPGTPADPILTEICTKRVGEGVARIIVGTNLSGWNPAWSPDGSRIAFYRRSPNSIWVVPAAGGTAVPLTDESNPAIDPAWSPDGSRIACCAGTGNIWVMDADGKNPVRVTKDPAYEGSPAWAPDGRSLAMIRRVDNKQDVWILRF
jgi:WD40 repeat protein